MNAARRADGKLPGNLILTRDGGDHRPRLQPIRERFGRTWGCFVEMPVERGIAIALGMDPVAVPRLDPAGFGGAAEEAYAAWAALAADALADFEALYVHIKGPDVPAHDGRAEDKRDVISAIDRAFFAEVLPRIGPGTVVAVTADHSTSCVRKAHTADPVPLVRGGGSRHARRIDLLRGARLRAWVAGGAARSADPSASHRADGLLTCSVARFRIPAITCLAALPRTGVAPTMSIRYDEEP